MEIAVEIAVDVEQREMVYGFVCLCLLYVCVCTYVCVFVCVRVCVCVFCHLS